MLDSGDKSMFLILFNYFEGLGLLCKISVNICLFSVECAV